MSNIFQKCLNFLVIWRWNFAPDKIQQQQLCWRHSYPKGCIAKCNMYNASFLSFSIKMHCHQWKPKENELRKFQLNNWKLSLRLVHMLSLDPETKNSSSKLKIIVIIWQSYFSLSLSLDLRILRRSTLLKL